MKEIFVNNLSLIQPIQTNQRGSPSMPGVDENGYRKPVVMSSQRNLEIIYLPREMYKKIHPPPPLHTHTRTASPHKFLYKPYQGGSFVAVLLCLCVGGFICGAFCHYLFLISPFGASRRMCFAIKAFPEYLYLYFFAEYYRYRSIWSFMNP